MGKKKKYVFGKKEKTYDSLDRFSTKAGSANATVGSPVVLSFEEKLFKDGRIDVVVPQEVIDILRAVEKEVGPGYEFSVLFKGRWSDEEGAFVVEPEYYIPEQRVRSAFVEITEDVAGKILQGYIVAFHKHPSGLRTFSGHDYENICAVFPISLLYVDNDVPMGTVKVPLDNANATVLVPARIRIKKNEKLPKVEGVEKIKKEYSYVHYGGYGSYGSSWRGYSGTTVGRSKGLDYPDEFRRAWEDEDYENGVRGKEVELLYDKDEYVEEDSPLDTIYEAMRTDLIEANSVEDIKEILEEWSVSSLQEMLETYGDIDERLRKTILDTMARFGNVSLNT